MTAPIKLPLMNYKFCLAIAIGIVMTSGAAAGNVPTPCVNVFSENKGWYQPDQLPSSRALLKEAAGEGVKAVRLNLFPFETMSDPAQSRMWRSALRDLVSYGNGIGLHVIIDLHESNMCSREAEECVAELRRFWQQTASDFSASRYDVSYEILNEPKGAIASRWSALFPQIIKIIRASDRSHSIIVGGKGYSTIWDLPRSDPSLKNVIYTFHYYNPMGFTHQGADWLKAYPALAAKRNVGWGSYADRQKLRNDLRSLDGWLLRNRAELFMGEFGVFKRAPAPDRELWTRELISAADARNVSWCIFDYEGGFGVRGNVKRITAPQPHYTAD